MKRTHSFSLQLSLVFLFLLLLVILLGTFDIGSLSYFNGASSQIRDRWLPSTRVLGDLNNFTSDHRVAEASLLLATDVGGLLAGERQLDDLDRSIQQSENIYAQMPRSAAQSALHSQFWAQWSEYRAVAQQVRALAAAGDPTAARALYDTTSRKAYDLASHTFDLLNESNVESARQASSRSATVYARVQWLIGLTIAFAATAVACAMIYVRGSISGPVAVELASSRLALEQQASLLQERLAEEQRLMQLQRNFVSMASHEFRTPLTIIDAHAQRMIAMKDRLRPDDLAERAGKVRTAVLRMTHLIHNLIDSARVMDGELELYFHPTVADLALLLREVCALQREITPHARIFEDLEAQSLRMTADANLLFQVFTNLLSNAVKYSPGAAIVKVTARCEENSYLVCVEDQGIGIPESDCERVFERYYRCSNGAGITGTGVGLYFVKMVVELHGGTVEAERGDAGGSRLRVRLPIRLHELRCRDTTSSRTSLSSRSASA